MAEKTATFAIRIAVESNADDAAKGIQALQRELARGEQAVKQYSAAYRNLHGNSEQVKVAKMQLIGRINAERDAVSRATLALTEQGAGLREVKSKTQSLGVVTAQTTGSLLSMGTALAAVGVGLVAGMGALAKWAIEGANAYRTMGLFREAAADGKANADALGTQIEKLAGSVPQTREELNKLSISLSKALVNTRGFAGTTGGQALVDTFNAVAQASAAMGDEVGARFEEIAKRGRMFGRIGIGLQELQGTGVSTRDVAGELAKNLKIGTDAALMQLVSGRVKVEDGMKAIRDTVEKKFGGINARRMLDLNVMATKFKDTLKSLTRDINLEPMLQAFSKIAEKFSETSFTGQTIKRIITEFGDAVTRVFAKAAPIVGEFVDGSIVLYLRLENAALRVANTINDTFGVNLLKVFGEGKGAAEGLSGGFLGLSGAIKHTGEQVESLVRFLKDLVTVYEKVDGVVGKLTGREILAKGLRAAGGTNIGAQFGENLKKGFIDAIVPGRAGSKIFDAAASLGGAAKAGMADSLEIKSPSKVFQRMGEQSVEGYEQGLGGGGVSVKPPAVEMKGGGGGGGPVTLNLQVSFPNASNGQEVASTLTSQSFRLQMEQWLEGLARRSGVPIREGA